MLYVVLFGLMVPAAGAQPDGAVHEYLTHDEALAEVLPEATHFVVDTLRLGPEALATAAKALHRTLDEAALAVTLGYGDDGTFAGYAVISDEVGKYRPITYVVGITPKLKVATVAIMVYREDRGGEVRLPRFLSQYRGKSADDPIRTNRDIINVSGATLSVRAVNRGVKKVLYLVTERYAKHPPSPTYEQAIAHRSSGANG